MTCGKDKDGPHAAWHTVCQWLPLSETMRQGPDLVLRKDKETWFNKSEDCHSPVACGNTALADGSKTEAQSMNQYMAKCPAECDVF